MRVHQYKNKNENQTQKCMQDSVQIPDTLSQLVSRASLLSKRIRQSRSHKAWRAVLSSLTAPASGLSKAGLTLWACLLLQPTDSLENISCRGSCSASISAAPLKHKTRDTRYINLKNINLKFQFVVHGNK